MSGFHHSAAVLVPLPFRRSAVVKFRCSVKKLRKKIPFRYSRKQQKERNGSGKGNGVRKRQRCTETATANGNSETESKGMVEIRHQSKVFLK